MLKLLHPAGGSNWLCDGIPRREFLRIGGLALGGWSLRDLLAAEARAGVQQPHKAVIMIYLVGGPPHQDLWDLKPTAPAEIAGPMRPTQTNVAGMEICDLLPQLAKRADRFAVIRSIADSQGDHDAGQCYTGFDPIKNVPAGGWPQFGSVVARLQGPVNRAVPPFASVCYKCTHPPYNEPGPGFLGVGQIPFNAQGPSRDDMVLQGVTSGRLGDRRALLRSVDRLRREVDHAQKLNGLDELTEQALNILTSSRLAEALDLSREEGAVRGRYGLDRAYPKEREGKTLLDQFLLARRVIEAGARCVTLVFSRWPFGRMLKGDYNWDWHKDIFAECRGALPLFDLGLSALIQDLHERGLLDDIAVVAWGEFGRTPKINRNAGRDHWAPVAGALLAGGGMRMGQVLGSTTRWGEQALTRPLHFRDVFATLYERLGIDVVKTQYNDLAGRPQYLVGEHRPIPELLA